MKYFYKKDNTKGFTIIEVMITISLFTLFIITGIGALLNASYYHKQNQKFSSIMDTLSFIMDDMSTNLRTGSAYVCGAEDIGDPQNPDCDINSHVLSFTNNNTTVVGGEKWIYAFTQGADGYGDLKKSTDGSWPLSSNDNFNLNPQEVRFDANSGFKVVGALPATITGGPTDQIQPYIVINLSGVVIFRGKEIPFSLQTSVSQRLIDVDKS